jgi:hypothetical protein
LRPDFAVLAPARPGTSDNGGSPRLLVSVYPAGTSMRAHLPAESWSASPVDRMAAHCRSVGCQLGLVTDGDVFTLVWANPSGGVGSATWIASVFAEGGEAALLDSFTTILGAKRFFSVAAPNQLEALLAESANAQTEVTNQLGLQVRQAVELLVAAISRAERDRADTQASPLLGVDPTVVYQAACTVLMRIVFLLYAEERRLLPLGDARYDDNYAASTLLGSLKTRLDADEPLDYSFTVWPRLLALFRAVHGGLTHDLVRIPPYGGGLFDPDRYPFLEGRSGGSWRTDRADGLRIDDRTMHGVLSAVQELRFSEAGVTETRRLSFRSLDVEQIGHVYEGLLDHTATPITEVTVGLVGPAGRESEVPLTRLEVALAQGPEVLAALLTELGVSKRDAGRAASPVPDDRRRRLREAAETGELTDRLMAFAAVIRDDLRGLPIVLLPGTFYVTETSTRRDGGIEYTPRTLADEVVHYALQPIAYSPGPAETGDAAQWKLKSSDQLLALKVCDPAAGSGAFLVAATRWLADRLVEAWKAEGNPLVDQLGGHADLAVDDVDDLTLEARRQVAERCIYGVDRDPMAVEMAKLSLWLTTMAKERPFSFVDHAIACGDTLLGVTSLDQITHFHIDPAKAKQITMAGDLTHLVDTALAKRRELATFTVRTAEDIAHKARLLREADEASAFVELIGDLIIGAALVSAPRGNGSIDDKLAIVSPLIADALTNPEQREELRRTAQSWLNRHRPDAAPLRTCAHWPLAFPEVFADGGRFDAIVGNPPFLGGQRLTARIGEDVRECAVEVLANGRRGSADLVAYFFLRAAQTSKGFGMLATNTIGQGDTREVGLDALTADGWTIHAATKSMPWPGSAVLEISKVWARSGNWQGGVSLDGLDTVGITTSLDRASRVTGKPKRLDENATRSFQGTIVLGLGFVLTPEDALGMIQQDARNADVLFPYLGGKDLNESPTHSPSRWIINFFDWPEERAREYASCFAIVEKLVKPERQRTKTDGSYVQRKPLPQKWWIYAEKRPGLYRSIRDYSEIVIIAQTSKTQRPAVVSSAGIFDQKTIVFAGPADWYFAVLSSDIHWHWIVKRGSTQRVDPVYTPSDVFETFPFPQVSEVAIVAGNDLRHHRSALMIANNEGLTKTYNRANSEADRTEGIVKLRELHVALDLAVRNAYGWSDLVLDHGFHPTPQGVRFTVSQNAQTELLDRLLEENHRRAALQGEAKPKKGTKQRPSATSEQESMF